MKIAVCLYGISPFETKKYKNRQPYETSIDEEYKVEGSSYHSLKSWKNNIINHNEVDFFIHSWVEKEEYKRKLLKVFRPKNFQFEKMIVKDSVISSSLSIKKCLEVLKSHEELNHFAYDLVLICRMDIVWFKPIILEKTFRNDKFTVVHWGIRDLHPNKNWDEPYEGSKYGTHDVLFACNSDNAKLYATLFDHIQEYRERETDLESHHTIKRYHIEQTGLISIIDHKLIVNKDLEIESRCFLSNPDFVNYLQPKDNSGSEN